MAPPHHNPPTKRIAIAIDLDYTVPWHQDCCEGILRYGESHGWSCAIDPYLLGPRGQQATDVYEGVVGRIDAQVAQAAADLGIPAVNHWSNSPAGDLPSVMIDNRRDGQIVAEHLVTCGYRYLAYIGEQADVTGERYLAGLNQGAADAGLPPARVHLYKSESDFPNRRQWLLDFLQVSDQWLADLSTPAGLLVGDSTVARYLAQNCMERGLTVPNDVGIAVWNDDMNANAVTPSLTVVEHDWFGVGYQSAALLDELLQGKDAHPLHRLVASDRLIVRDSTDVFICEDPLVKDAVRYIAEHCRQELRIEQIAAALSTSRRTLYRKFDQVLGRSIKDEIKRLRIDRLKLMVEETELPLVDLANEFGFSSPGQFTRYFTNAVGVTPSAYRKRYRAGQSA